MRNQKKCRFNLNKLTALLVLVCTLFAAASCTDYLQEMKVNDPEVTVNDPEVNDPEKKVNAPEVNDPE